MDENKLSTISQADSYEAIGAFWDDHDFVDFDDPNRPDVEFDITETVRIETDLMHRLRQIAQERGVTLETLVNLWLQEKVLQPIV